MKIGIISDTHDNTPGVKYIVDYLNQHNIETAFHAGDIINPGNIKYFENNYQGQLHFVFGNNDGERGRIVSYFTESDKIHCHFETMDEVFAEKRIFMHHFSNIGELVAQNKLFDVVIGGHDHIYRVKEYGETLFVNPGALSLTDYINGRRDRGKNDNSFVILDLKTMEHERIMVPYYP